ncbi:ATP-binding cassette domain-containing protein [Modestobacter sp. SYSU DS0657]
MGLRLPVGGVTVLVGPAGAREATLAALDPGSARCAGGHASLPVLRLTASPDDDVQQRLGAVEQARAGAASVVLVDHLTDGLAAADRHAVLAALREVARAGRAVLVDDGDPVAALSVADGLLRTPALTVEQLPDADQLEQLVA